MYLVFVSCTNIHHDVKYLLNHGMLKTTKTWISWVENITFLQNKKILSLCLRWHILRSYCFLVEVTFNYFCISFFPSIITILSLPVPTLLPPPWLFLYHKVYLFLYVWHTTLIFKNNQLTLDRGAYCEWSDFWSMSDWFNYEILLNFLQKGTLHIMEELINIFPLWLCPYFTIP